VEDYPFQLSAIAYSLYSLLQSITQRRPFQPTYEDEPCPGDRDPGTHLVELFIGFCLEQPERSRLLGDLGMCGKIMIKWFLKIEEGEAKCRYVWLKTRTSGRVFLRR